MNILSKRPRVDAPKSLILFVHIPKTGGTSLRFEMERRYSKSSIVGDYGPHSASTSEIAMEYLYHKHGPARVSEFIDLLRSQNKVALAGHYRLSKFSKFFPPENVVSLIRDPLHRAASEFLHVQRHKQYAGSFSDFFHDPNMVNRLTKLLDVVNERMIIGTTERYSESLELINRKLGLSLRPAKKNVAPKGGAKQFVDSLSTETLDLFCELNKIDYELYSRINERLSAQAID